MHSKVSIITVVYNREHTIRQCIDSVNAQDYPNIEHIIIDGASTDGTLQIVKQSASTSSKIISEPDQGIYDALNKGINIATGDLIGILHSDDQFASSTIITDMVNAFSTHDCEGVYADAAFFKPQDPQRITRYYSSNAFHPDHLAHGDMPAHTTLFLKKSVFERIGDYSLDYPVSADFEFFVRLFHEPSIRLIYVPKLWVLMQVGGISTSGIRSKIKVNQDVIRACRKHGIATNYFKLFARYPRKLIGYFRIP